MSSLAGGLPQEGEDPLHGAQREFREETGWETNEWIPLGRGVVDASRGGGIDHLYLALGARQVGETIAGDREPQELLELTEEELATALH
jgi:8-oxo-dGTP pyrophosphatase MutT (NUDIX family)